MRIFWLLVSLFLSFSLNAAPTQAELSVWVNEAIVSTYTYNYQNYLSEQKKIARYFTPKAWIAYSAALHASHLSEDIQTHKYAVTAVATDTPIIQNLGVGQWKASMPVLVIYKNPQYEQKQTLLVTIQFKVMASGEGVRGFAIEGFQSKTAKPACKCDLAA